MRTISIFLLIAFLLLLVGCIHTPPVNEKQEIWSDSITNGLISYAIKTTKHKDYLFGDKAILWFSLDNLLEVINRNPGFTLDDTTFMRKQLRYDRKFEFRIDTVGLSKYEFISFDTLTAWGLGGPKNSEFWSIYKERVHRCFCLIYCPIYNRDKSFAIMSTVDYCGSKWIESYDILYMRNGKTWSIVDTTSRGGS